MVLGKGNAFGMNIAWCRWQWRPQVEPNGQQNSWNLEQVEKKYLGFVFFSFSEFLNASDLKLSSLSKQLKHEIKIKKDKIA